MTSAGIPLPYTPQCDDGLAAVLLCCFLLSALVLSRSRKFLVQLAKDFMLNRERTSIFATSTTADMHYLLLLVLQTCVLAGVFIFCCQAHTHAELLQHASPTLLLVGCVALSLLYICTKWILYSFLGWIFFDSAKITHWLESYSTLLYYFGFLIFPSVLLLVYFNIGLPIALIWGLISLVFTKILMLYKWLKLFCNNLYGCFLLILYFCALEIVPCILIYRVLTDLTDYLTIKI